MWYPYVTILTSNMHTFKPHFTYFHQYPTTHGQYFCLTGSTSPNNLQCGGKLVGSSAAKVICIKDVWLIGK